MSYLYENRNPCQQKDDDCVIRAISTVTDKSWKDVFWDLAVRSSQICDLPNANRVWMPYLESLGFIKFSLPNNCPYCYTIKDFAKDHKHGIYVVGDGQHAVAVVDGYYIDNYDSGDRTVLFYFEKEW